MSTRFINLIPVCLLASLVGCASGPSDDSGGSSAATVTSIKAADVDSSTKSAFKKAVNTMKNGRDDSAIKQFQAIIQAHPNLASAFVNIGLIHLKRKRYEKAEKNLLQATTLQPADPIGQTHLGLVYRHLGKFKEAQQAYEQALKSDPNYSFAHLNAGILYDIYLNDLARALTHYQQYQTLTNSSDKTVDKWIIDLQRRVKKNG